MKRSLRAELRSRRAALSPEDRSRFARAVAQRILALESVRHATCIGGYRALPTELDLTPTLLLLREAKKRLALPRVQGEHLRFHAWEPGDALERGPHGVEEPRPEAAVMEPAELDLVLVPGIAFDRRGHRLGFGRGFYDRFLARIPRARRLGVAFDIQLVESLPVDPHDSPVGWVVTPNELLRFDH